MSPSNERSAEWLRGAVESHINTCNLITSITSATKSHPARQGLMAAGNELHNQLDRYRALLAAAEAREAAQPTAAEVIEAAERALLQVGKWDSFTQREKALMKDALASIGDWKEANGE